MKKTSVFAWVISLIVYGGLFFWVGKMSTPAPPEVDSYELMVARAQARGVEQARLKHAADQRKSIELAQQKKEAEFDKAQKRQTQIEDMGLISVEDISRNWVEIGNGWKIRNVATRIMDVASKDEEQSHTIEFVLSRTDNTRPRLTRLVGECFDENLEFLCPIVVDISATDAQLSYVRPGFYYLRNRTPKYCRFTTAAVNKVKYKNTYPEDN